MLCLEETCKFLCCVSCLYVACKIRDEILSCCDFIQSVNAQFHNCCACRSVTESENVTNNKNAEKKVKRSKRLEFQTVKFLVFGMDSYILDAAQNGHVQHTQFVNSYFCLLNLEISIAYYAT